MSVLEGTPQEPHAHEPHALSPAEAFRLCFLQFWRNKKKKEMVTFVFVPVFRVMDVFLTGAELIEDCLNENDLITEIFEKGLPLIC